MRYPTIRICWLLWLAVFTLAAAPAYAQTPRVSVQVDGVGGEVRENVLAFLSLYAQRAHPALSEGRIRTLHRRAEEEIRRALEPFGYYRPTVRTSLEQRETDWLARYEINPGPRIPLTEVDVQIIGEGADTPAFRETLRTLPLQRDAPLEHARYEQAKRALQRTAASYGYLNARLVRHELRIDLEAYEASAVLHLDSGPRFRLGEVEFHPTVVRPELLQRFVPFEPGEPYRSARLLELQTALGDSNYFADVVVQPRHDQEEDLELPVEVRLTPRERQQYTVSLGYGTDTGARTGLGFENRYVNARGHRLRGDMLIAERRNRIAARYIVPVRDPRTDSIEYSAAWQDEQARTFRSETLQISAGHTRARGSWRETIALTYLDERYTIADQRDRSTLWMPSGSWTRIWADDRIYTRRGGQFGFDVRGAAEELGSDVDFTQSRVQGTLIRPLLPRSRIILRGEAGTTLIGDINELPASLRFTAGGDHSVRGYAYRSLGPTDAEGRVVGGKHLLFGSVEYEHTLYGLWSAALFYDRGNAINSISDPLESGAGFGVRWRSPVGLIRLDVASAISQPGNPWRLHLRIGPDL
ncbi:outer membrane protein assembly factor [Ectothiorhodospiraceae bacterium 2226]|nr:outer membrane protein assembly factor [Ectothiorhodospiraceae bacterium 2226]